MTRNYFLRLNLTVRRQQSQHPTCNIVISIDDLIAQCSTAAAAVAAAAAAAAAAAGAQYQEAGKPRSLFQLRPTE